MSGYMDASIAIVSHTFAPDINGQAVVLGRLFEGRSGVVRLSSDRLWRPAQADGCININVSPPWLIRKLRKAKLLETSIFRLYVSHRAKMIASALRSHHCSCVIACTGGDLVDIPASIVAAERTGVPCILHYFDDYRSQWKIPNPIWSSRWMERHGLAIEEEFVNRALGVVVPNELLYSELTERVQLPLKIIRNPVGLMPYQSARNTSLPEKDGSSRSWRISYTGSIYEAQLDAVVNCARGIELLSQRGIAIQLHLYTSQSRESLQNQGVPESVQIHPAVPLEEAVRVQCESDFLLLPLAFRTRYPELIRTSAPGKMGEYLAAGRPILFHAPTDSFLVKFASEQKCGLICDIPDKVQIASQIERLVRDSQLRAMLSERARQSSLLFSESVNREQYFKFIGEHTNRHFVTEQRLRVA
jgi:glycosyltransferase involved in cell wall biosynthesis